MLIILLVVFVSAAFAGVAPPNSVPMKLVNHAGMPIELFWIDAYKPGEKLVMQTSKPLRNNSATNINSYDTHKFRVKFFKKQPPYDKCQADFVKGPSAENIEVTYDPKTNKLEAEVSTKFTELMGSIKSATKKCEDKRGEEFSKCIAIDILDDVTRIEQSKTRLTNYRDLMSSRLRNYTCEDDTMNTSAPLRTSVFIDPKEKNTKNSTTYTVQTLLDQKHSKIWLVEDFISPDECAALKNHGSNRLTRATVAGEDGASILSDSRKANQATYNSHNNPADPLHNLYHRAMALTTRETQLNIQPEGQEGFTIIQYDKDDEYTPHCDGACDHSMHLTTGRVATAVMYCTIADRGGATTFTKADIFVKPKPGMATFFSYKGTDGRMDDGLTEHSGCPVLEGEKWITTLWMREGVSLQDPWQLYDPNGIRLMQ